MADQLQFGTLVVNGHIMPFLPAERRNLVYRTSFPGLNGISELHSGHGGRVLQVRMLIADPARSSAAALATFINTTLQRDMIGIPGTLQITTAAGWPAFGNCTYDGFQLTDGILPDVAGLLASGFFCIGNFQFFQRL